MSNWSHDSRRWEEMVGVYKKKKKAYYIKTDPKLREIHLSGHFIKRAPKKKRTP